MPVIAEEADRSPALARTQSTEATATQNTAPTSALESMTLNMTVAQRVALRRRKPVTPFIQRKAKATTKAATKATRAVLRRRAAPVFGTASLFDRDEMALMAALKKKKPQMSLINQSNGILSQRTLPTEGPIARITNNVDEGSDEESDEENRPVREGWSFGDLRDEKKRRLEVFNAREKGHEALHQCDSCSEVIISTRYECKYCDNFDLCRDCYTQPTVTFKHQHAADETVVR